MSEDRPPLNVTEAWKLVKMAIRQEHAEMDERPLGSNSPMLSKFLRRGFIEKARTKHGLPGFAYYTISKEGVIAVSHFFAHLSKQSNPHAEPHDGK